MDREFWHTRWREGRTGWHRKEVEPQLARFWPALGIAPGARVLVPLCGKAHDMAWLAALGHPLLGVELSEVACRAFFTEHGLAAEEEVRDGALSLRTDGIELICGDVFALPPAAFADVDAVYDRAALIALPPPMRAQYASTVYAALPTGCRGLLITLEYPAGSRDGPPFCVREAEVRALLPGWRVDCLGREPLAEDDPLRGTGPGHGSVAWSLRHG
jgi:thiopurine S-methyltransferase